MSIFKNQSELIFNFEETVILDFSFNECSVNNLEKKVSYSIQGRLIWGATANILNQLLNKI